MDSINVNSWEISKILMTEHWWKQNWQREQHLIHQESVSSRQRNDENRRFPWLERNDLWMQL